MPPLQPHSITTRRTSGGRSWRFRRCPKCHTVRAASQFAVAQSLRPGWDAHGTMKRRCPACGHTGPTSDFQVVREARAGGAAW